MIPSKEADNLLRQSQNVPTPGSEEKIERREIPKPKLQMGITIMVIQMGIAITVIQMGITLSMTHSQSDGDTLLEKDQHNHRG